MRCSRLIVSVVGLAFGLALSGCETSNFADKIQDTVSDMNVFGTNKKPLPGDRREVFPGGVPGVTQGVPPDLVKGNPAAMEPDPAAAPPPQAAPPPAPKKKRVVAVKKRPPRPAPPRANAAPPAEDGVWPPAPSSAPPPADSNVWPPPPR